MSKYFLSLAGGVCLALSVKGQVAYPSAPAPPAPIVGAEYFFDRDPGQGNGTPITFTAGTNISNLSVDLALSGSALTNGFHWVYVRTRNSDGVWSHTAAAFFDNAVIQPYPSAPAGVVPITAAEYFIDTDPGPGNGTAIPITAGNEVSANVLVNLTGLPAGAHTLYVRSRNSNGLWSHTNFALFNNAILTPYPSAPAVAPPLVSAEYFLDTDPGFGNGTPIAIPASTDVSDFNFSIPLTGVEQGLHTVYVRSTQQPWSLAAYAEFVFGSILPVTWKYVKAEKKQQDALITWATASEENAASFVIEYSRDGHNFSRVGDVAATNNSAGSSYQFTHTQPGSGAAYYRIKQVDIDGHFTYSRTLVLLYNDNLRQPIAFPNPAKDILHIATQGTMRDQVIRIIDMSGKTVRTLRMNSTQENLVSLPLQGLARGQYFVKISDGKSTTSIAFTKE